MTNIYIVLLRNNHLIFSDKKPTRRGNYTKDVRLFKTKGTVNCTEICAWVNTEFDSQHFSEIIDWD
ncbi:MAG: hypothetical protein VW397_09225 [Candidatus Margulisiibacteriota bacterium]